MLRHLSGFRFKILQPKFYMDVFISLMHATYPAYHILLELVALVRFYQEAKSRSSSLLHMSPVFVTRSLHKPYTLN
jgi:hypothetical protein